MDVCLVNLSDTALDDEELRHSLMHAPAGSMLLFEDVDGLFVGRDKVRAGGGGGGWSMGGGGGGGGNGVDGGRGGSGVTFSGLLNALDGVASQQGKIAVMTTNHIERLDPALIRPGRCDVVEEIPAASPEQIRRMFRRFFPKADVLGSDMIQELYAANGADEDASTQADANANGTSAAAAADDDDNDTEAALSVPPAARRGISSSFVSLLPSGSISLAKLQGFFLERRGRPDLALRDI